MLVQVQNLVGMKIISRRIFFIIKFHRSFEKLPLEWDNILSFSSCVLNEHSRSPLDGLLLPLYSDGVQSTWAEALLLFMLETQCSCEELSTKHFSYQVTMFQKYQNCSCVLQRNNLRMTAPEPSLRRRMDLPAWTEQRSWPGLLRRSPMMLSCNEKKMKDLDLSFSLPRASHLQEVRAPVSWCPSL